jgi:hypothetical protein
MSGQDQRPASEGKAGLAPRDAAQSLPSASEPRSTQVSWEGLMDLRDRLEAQRPLPNDLTPYVAWARAHLASRLPDGGDCSQCGLARRILKAASDA